MEDVGFAVLALAKHEVLASIRSLCGATSLEIRAGAGSDGVKLEGFALNFESGEQIDVYMPYGQYLVEDFGEASHRERLDRYLSIHLNRSGAESISEGFDQLIKLLDRIGRITGPVPGRAMYRLVPVA